MVAMKRTFRDRGYPWWHWRRVANRMERKGRAFEPFVLDNQLLAWWDASRGITITGAGVSAWVDRKSGYSVLQATDASRPAYSATGFNGVPGLTFDGTADFLNMESQPFPQNDGNFEIWIVAQNDAAGATTGNKFVASIGGVSPTNAGLTRNTNNVMRAITTSVTAEATGPFATRHVFRGTFKTGQVAIQVDGGTAVTAVVDPAIGATRMRIGANNENTAAAFWHGKVRDVIVTRILTAAQAAELHTFLLARREL